MRIEARKIEDGRGPYRWRKVIRAWHGVALGSIYDLRAAEITREEYEAASSTLAAAGYEWREVPA